jgi:hypothetical protein
MGSGADYETKWWVHLGGYVVPFERNYADRTRREAPLTQHLQHARRSRRPDMWLRLRRCECWINYNRRLVTAETQ